MKRELSAGCYVVETGEKLLHGLSFPACRRVATFLRGKGSRGSCDIFEADPAELETALARDALGVNENQNIERSDGRIER